MNHDWTEARWHEWYDSYDTDGLETPDRAVPLYAELAGKDIDRTNFESPRRLARGYATRVESVRAICSEPLTPPVRHHLRHTYFRLAFNRHPVIEAPLIDLVLAPKRVGAMEIGDEHGVDGRVRIGRATPALKAYLNAQYGALDGMQALLAETADKRHADAFKACGMTVWVFFGGPTIIPVK